MVSLRVLNNTDLLPQRAPRFEWTERSVDETHGPRYDDGRYAHLDALEDQSVFIIREAFKKFGKTAMLWSIGKDSSVLLWLVRKAFFGNIPFDLVHIDTAFKIPQMIEFRERYQRLWNFNLVVGQNKAALLENKTFAAGNATRIQCCSALKKDGLQAVIQDNDYEAVYLGIRRDEEGTRAKERYFSPRNKTFQWDFKDQPPELWDQYKTDFEPGTHLRVHPLLHWTEENIWEYIARERIPVVPLYFAHQGKRYRSLGCAPCTTPVESTAITVAEILEELRTTNIAERSTRAQDQEAEDAFEQLRSEGYM